jgi:hypothetical protein
MAIKHIILLFVETPRKFITAKKLLLQFIAVINLRGASTKKSNIYLSYLSQQYDIAMWILKGICGELFIYNMCCCVFLFL